MSKLSLGVEKAAHLPAPLGNVERALAAAGGDVKKIRLLEELAEAAKRYATSHEQRIEASVAKLKIARHGGQTLIDMAKRGERRTKTDGQSKVSQAAIPNLDGLGLTLSRSSRWQAVAKLAPDKFEARLEAVGAEGEDDSLAVQDPGGTKAHGIVEWYTPARYVEAAREVMGGIDLDPASSELANQTVRATLYFDSHLDGLMEPWLGRVWLNPPYGKGSGLFTTKLVTEYAAGNVTAGILLLNAYGFDSDWFQPLWDWPICFTDHRITFWSPQRETGGPANANIFVYLGPDDRRFAEVFRQFGRVVRSWP